MRGILMQIRWWVMKCCSFWRPFQRSAYGGAPGSCAAARRVSATPCGPSICRISWEPCAVQLTPRSATIVRSDSERSSVHYHGRLSLNPLSLSRPEVVIPRTGACACLPTQLKAPDFRTDIDPALPIRSPVVAGQCMCPERCRGHESHQHD